MTAQPLEPDALWNLINRAEDGVITAHEASVLRRCVRVIVDRTENAEAERARYRSAWQSARRRAAENEEEAQRQYASRQRAEMLLENANRVAAGKIAQEPTAMYVEGPAAEAALGQALVRTSSEQLGLASEFRIPCPGHLYAGHHSDLLVRRNPDGQGWCIINPNLPDGGEHVWNGQQWRYRGELSRAEIYRYSRDEALTEAPKLAAAEAARSQAWAAEMRDRGAR